MVLLLCIARQRVRSVRTCCMVVAIGLVQGPSSGLRRVRVVCTFDKVAAFVAAEAAVAANTGGDVVAVLWGKLLPVLWL